MGNKFVAKKRALQARTTNSCTSQQTYLYTAAETLRLQTLLLNRHSKRRNQNSYERVSKIYGGLFLQGSLRKNAHVFFFANQYKPMKCVVNIYANATKRVSRNTHPCFVPTTPPSAREGR